MRKTVCLISFLLLLFLSAGCGSDDPPQQPDSQKDSIDRVSDAASDFGYDGEAIEENLREMDAAAKEHAEEIDKIFEE
jgi:predicted small lipoprotein YifL